MAVPIGEEPGGDPATVLGRIRGRRFIVEVALSRGAVAAGHPLTAEAGAWALREGGNAVDAAVCAVLASFATESPLTGFGAGGFMLVHTRSDNVLLDFFIEAPGRGEVERASELIPVPVYFSPDAPQVFHIGAASCGVPGTAAGLEEAVARFGSMPLSELVKPATGYAREGVRVTAQQAFIFTILEPILTAEPLGREIYAPEGQRLREGEVFRFEELADALERFGAEGAEPFYRGELAAAIADWVVERGGTLSAEDLAAYAPIERTPVRGFYRGRDVLTNPPPSSGGILIAFVLDLLDRLGASGPEELVTAMEAAQEERTEEFLDELGDAGFAERFLAQDRLTAAAERVRSRVRGNGSESPGDRLGSTTHITAVDASGSCASATCSNGTGSGLIVPGTGVHVNNMLGEEDLNPHGFHRHPPGRRLPSMMSPTVILRGGEIEAGLGSGGSNRIRSAVVQAIIRMLDDGLGAQAAVEAPRLHYEAGSVQAEPGIDEEALRRLERRGYAVARWEERNLFFGGVHAVSRDPGSGDLVGGGDPRRGGAAVVL
jgi:gamma-glutamyltranspeptidase/glutathione hydrolase